MVLKVSLPGRITFRILRRDRKRLHSTLGEIHYIGGTEILPAPLSNEMENEMVMKLGTEEEEEARGMLIEHNMMLVVYI